MIYMNDMAFRGTKRARPGLRTRTRKMLRKPSGSKRRLLRTRKPTRRAGTFAKRVKRSLYKLTESKVLVCYMPTLAGGTPIFNLKGKQITILSVDPLVNNTTAYNMLERRVNGVGANYQQVGGEPATLVGSTGRIYGDAIQGNEMTPTYLRVRGEFRNTIWAPPSKTVIMLVVGNVGDVPTQSILWKNQLNNSFLDDFNYPRFKLIGKYEFYLGGVSKTGNKNADEHKPGGGTTADYSTGTYWNVDGVAVPSDAQEATMTENVVNFNGAATMECMAPKVHMMDWKISLKSVGKVHYSGGSYASGLVTPAKDTKEKAMWLVAYNYANNLQGANEQHANVIVDELHWKLHFKDL
nr:MAG: hypothetical protein [Skomarfal virus 53]